MIRKSLPVLLLLVLPVAGCVMPPAVSVASFALDGVSTAASGKTVGDHAMSVAAQRDCALWRLFTDAPMCSDFAPGEEPWLVAEAAAWAASGEVVGADGGPVLAKAEAPADARPRAPHPYGGFMVESGRGAERPRARPAAFVAPGPGAARARPAAGLAMPITPDVLDVAPAAGPAAPAATAPGGDGAARHVVVIGSFRRFANARRTAERWTGLAAAIVSLEVAGIRFWRVVTAPADAGGIAEQKRRLFEAGIDKVWVAPLCADGPRRPRCVALPAAARPWRR